MMFLHARSYDTFAKVSKIWSSSPVTDSSTNHFQVQSRNKGRSSAEQSNVWSVTDSASD